MDLKARIELLYSRIIAPSTCKIYHKVTILALQPPKVKQTVIFQLLIRHLSSILRCIG